MGKIKVSSSQQTANFYDNLMQGKEKRGILGKDLRYNPTRIFGKESTKKYFVDVISGYISKDDNVLDLGCGPGSFLISTASLCKHITGVDISIEFVTTCNKTIDEMKIDNAKAVHIKPDTLPFEDNSFDALIMVDVIHHLEDIHRTLKEAMRVVKQGGRILIYEPNKLNPLIAITHLLDRNEWGLLRLGTPWIYRKILSSYINIEKISFNGIVIGPQSPIFYITSDILNHSLIRPALGWLNPKMFITGRKK